MASKNITQEKSCKRFSLKEIAAITGDTAYSLNRRAMKLGIKGLCTGTDSTKYYTQEQINKIVAAGRVKYKNHKRKITIIEMYLKGISPAKIAEAMRIDLRRSYECVKEFNSFGTITVDSKVNYIVL